MRGMWAFLGAVTFLLGSTAWGQQARLYDDRPKIAVTGEAVVNVEPDKIIVTFGIETSDAEISSAKQKNGDILKRAVAAIKGCGVAETAIQTDHLSLEPRYRDDYIKESFIGYFVRNVFSVTVTDAGGVEKLVTEALQAGVSSIQGVEFQTTEFGRYREQARELALKAAKEKAGKMAAIFGQRVGAPIQIDEDAAGSPWGYGSSWSGWGYGRGQGMTQNVAQNVAGGPGDDTGTLALGKISIRASVAVTFELVP